jgi:hypothetical protein
MVVTITKKLVDSIPQSNDYINELGNISVHMAKNTRDEWTSSYNCTRMNEK